MWSSWAGGAHRAAVGAGSSSRQGREVERSPAAILLFLWALVDLLQIPLLAAVILSFRLSRRLGRAWKGVAVGFGAYAAWVVVTARFVPYSPSGLAVLLAGMLLDPRRETSPQRVWALGSAVAIALFWALPVALAAGLRRRPARVSPRPSPPASPP
jgi:hypothetical protein